MKNILIPHLIIVFVQTFFKNLQTSTYLLLFLAIIFLHFCLSYGTVNLNKWDFSNSCFCQWYKTKKTRLVLVIVKQLQSIQLSLDRWYLNLQSLILSLVYLLPLSKIPSSLYGIKTPKSIWFLPDYSAFSVATYPTLLLCSSTSSAQTTCNSTSVLPHSLYMFFVYVSSLHLAHFFLVLQVSVYISPPPKSRQY